MPYFYCEPKNVKGKTLVLTGDEAHHASHVMRHKIGDRIVAVDGMGMVYDSKIVRITETAVEARIVKKRRRPKEPVSSLTIAQGILKGPRMDYAVEKLTELGVKRIIPFLGERSTAVPEEGGEKTQRWRRIAISAMKQSERSVLPNISEVTSFEELVRESKEHDVFVVGWEEEKRKRITDLNTKGAGPILILVGPEGGLTESEVEALKGAGAITVTLGGRKLRSETASVVLSALVLEKMGDI